MEKLQQSISFEGKMQVDSQGHTGGVSLLWRYKDEVLLSSYRKNHIDATVKNKEGANFRLTGIYGKPDRSKRHETWHLLRTLSAINSFLWCLIGDMNNVISQADKQGSRTYPHSLVQGFRDVVDDCDLIDMPLVGHQFTWERGICTTEMIEVRMDRALVSAYFLNLFAVSKLVNLEVSTSDHSPILLQLHKSITVASNKTFHF